MATSPVIVNLNEQGFVLALKDSTNNLKDVGGDVVLDFSSLPRIDSIGLRALQDFVLGANEKSVKVIIRGVKVDVYKTLKLVKLTGRFSFEN